MKNASPSSGLAPEANGGEVDDHCSSAPAPGPATHHNADPRDGLIAAWEFKKNRAGQSIKIQIKRFRGVLLVDLRVWVPAAGGFRKPGEGFAAIINHLPALAATLRKAEARARELGLIEAEGSQ